MSNEGRTFLQVVRNIINDTSSRILKDVFVQSGKDKLVELTDNEMELVRQLGLHQAHYEILEKVLLTMGDDVVFRIFCILDGVTYTSPEIPDLALINRDTGAPIVDGYLHEEFEEVK